VPVLKRASVRASNGFLVREKAQRAQYNQRGTITVLTLKCGQQLANAQANLRPSLEGQEKLQRTERAPSELLLHASPQAVYVHREHHRSGMQRFGAEVIR
jgi:hypothetical protein